RIDYKPYCKPSPDSTSGFVMYVWESKEKFTPNNFTKESDFISFVQACHVQIVLFIYCSNNTSNSNFGISKFGNIINIYAVTVVVTTWQIIEYLFEHRFAPTTKF
ncbi:9456_t:CDS:2, partial [Racocetra persica]